PSPDARGPASGERPAFLPERGRLARASSSALLDCTSNRFSHSHTFRLPGASARIILPPTHIVVLVYPSRTPPCRSLASPDSSHHPGWGPCRYHPAGSSPASSCPVLRLCRVGYLPGGYRVLTSFSKRLFGRPTAAVRRQLTRPRLEALEDRLAPAMLHVY